MVVGLILTWLGNLLGGPFIKAALEAYQSKLKSDVDKTALAKDLGVRELDVQAREMELQTQLKTAQIGHAWEPEKLAMYITLVYYAKIVIWDVVLGSEGITHGSTDPLRGQIAIWAQMIMAFYFTKRGFENVAKIWRIK